MKNTIILLSIITFALSMGSGTAKAEGTHGRLTADVDTITMAQAAGENPSITVIDESGVSIMFAVTPATVISGPIGESIGLDDIQQNDTVEIQYFNLEGGFGTAKSIKLTE